MFVGLWQLPHDMLDILLSKWCLIIKTQEHAPSMAQFLVLWVVHLFVLVTENDLGDALVFTVPFTCIY